MQIINSVRPRLSMLSKHLMVKVLALVLGTAVLSSCYMPVKFDSELEVNRAGYYNIVFDGYLAETNLYTGLKDGKIDRAEEKKRVAVIERDMTRDTATKNFKYYKQGHFKLNWESSGDLLKTKMVTFLRANELIFQIKYVAKSGYIVFETKSISKDNRKRLIQAGLNMQGQIRFKTDMPIKSDNASFKKKDPKDPRFTWLVWDVKSVMGARPRAVFIIE